MSWSFTGPTAPFRDLRGGDPAVFSFGQVDDDRFTINEGILFDDGTDRVVVSADTLVDTDLASIPLFMAWFVPVNGRHTPAALVHDTLVADANRSLREGETDRGGAADRRAHADAVFLRAMESCEVPVLRRRLMHAAVTMATCWTRSVVARLALVLWVLASVTGTAVLVWSLVGGRWLISLAAVVAPVVAAPLWGWSNRAPAALAGYAAWFVAVPALATAASYAAYWSAEQLLRVIPGGAERDNGGPAPPPAPFR
ncbi:MAG: DUF1353 domain-containing protein [Microthrixaceae bacterium]|nr:DUF1353 domain-containing protein [Microthrixaceae bacterium]